VYRTYHNVDQAIKKLIIKSFDDAYLNVLSEKIVGYANCVLQLLTHLLTYYAMITGLFPDACRAWQSRAIAGKTWAQFKLDFATAHREFRLTNQTAQQSGFHRSNMMIEQGREETMQDTVNAIAQLATATASDRGTVATLTTTNAKLATQLEAAHAHIPQLKNEIATLKNKIKPAWQGQRPIKTTNNDSYCWLHGYQVATSHTSVTCNMKKSGHQDAVNKSNPIGGVQWGKE
jgi:hypothetical protein